MMPKLDLFPTMVGILLFLGGIGAMVAYLQAWLTLFQRGILFGVGTSLLVIGPVLGLMGDFSILYTLIIFLPLGCVAGLAMSANQAVLSGEYDRQVRLAKAYYHKGEIDQARFHATLAKNYKRALGRLRRFRPDQ